MNILGNILIFANLAAAPLIIFLIPGIRGIIAALTLSWLVLSPLAGVNLPGLPTLNKDISASMGVLIGIILFRAHMLHGFRLKPVDMLAIMWICAPFGSSIVNGLGPWDACSELYGQFLRWGVPYFAGRMATRSLSDLQECAKGVLIAGLIAVPLCLLEIRLSPQLHRWVYGIHSAPFHMTKRLGGYRPVLMFRHGIEVGAWMACATAIGCWFGITIGKRKFLSMPYAAHAWILLIVTIICRSLGSLVLLGGSLSAALLTRSSRLKVFLVVLILATPAYVGVRVTGLWDPGIIADFVEDNISYERARSLRGRLYQEVELGAKAADKPILGWGGQNRFRVFDDFGEATTAVDALWLLAYGKNGLVGLVGLYGMLCVPSLIILRRTPARLLFHANMAGAVGLILAVTIATGDSLQNAFFSPLMMVAAGALATTSVSLRSWLPRPTRAPATPQPPSPVPPRVSK